MKINIYENNNVREATEKPRRKNEPFSLVGLGKVPRENAIYVGSSGLKSILWANKVAKENSRQREQFVQRLEKEKNVACLG